MAFHNREDRFLELSGIFGRILRGALRVIGKFDLTAFGGLMDEVRFPTLFIRNFTVPNWPGISLLRVGS